MRDADVIIQAHEERISKLREALDLIIGFCSYGCEQCKDGASVCDKALEADDSALDKILKGGE